MADTAPQPALRPMTVLILLALPIPFLYVISRTLVHLQLDSLHYILAEIIAIALLQQYLGLPNLSLLLDQLLGGQQQKSTSALVTDTTAPASAANGVIAATTLAAPPAAGGPSAGVGQPKRNQYPGMADAMIKEFLEMADAVYSDPTSNPWSLVASVANPFIQVYKKVNTDFCFKVVVELETTPETIFDTLADIDHRRDWDEMCEDSGVVDNVDSNTKVQYMKTKGVFPASPRDAVVLAHVGKLPDGRYINVTRSVVHEGIPALDNTPANTIRMQVKIGGQVVGPAPNKPGFARVIQVADGDLKGWLPKSVVSFVATKAVPGGFITLNNMMKKTPQKQTSYTIEMAEKGQLPKISYGPKDKIGKLYYYDDGDTTTVPLPSTANGVIADAKINGTATNGHIVASATPSSSNNTVAVGMRTGEPNVWLAFKLFRNSLEYSSPMMVSVIFFMVLWKNWKK